ncbi:isopentenyl-diphosphate delta-isomerase [Batrachochytrium salamandrivorans]|nr:isopentenyl-diphosphate delta-isomerase [Batrachochytrium salamandrivorans]
MSTQYDPQQVELMQERIIVVDDEDRVIRSGSKEECHINRGDDEILLHRAFSVFLFDPSTNKLLLQQRASSKITFPDYWANTCCSHPLYCEEEMDTANFVGVKRAAIRKLKHELGITGLKVEDFYFLNTIHYHAPGEGGWGEHEVDHVLGVAAKDVNLDHVSPNEVQATKWFSQSELETFLSQQPKLGGKISPWFQKMAQNPHLLPRWWSSLGQMTNDAKDLTIYKL